ncbi:peptidylprolyl isomerase, partial [Escherichia coli]|nr:peptidylprolyl isomerase [Escherichia coli]
MPVAMARHILVKTEAEAAQLKQRLAKGEDFATLAKKHSTCPSGKRGG